MEDFWAWMTISDGLFSEFHEYETDYSGWASSGTVGNRWGIRSPMESILWNICFIQIKPLEGSVQVSSVAQSCPTLRPHESQHTRPPCPSPTPGVHTNSRPSSRWCHPAISSSVIPFSSCPQSLPASGSFPIWVNSSHEVAKVLEFQLQHQSFQWTPRTGLL